MPGSFLVIGRIYVPVPIVTLRRGQQEIACDSGLSVPAIAMVDDQWMFHPDLVPQNLGIAWIGRRGQDRQAPIHGLRVSIAVEKRQKGQALGDSGPPAIRHFDRHDLGVGMM